MTPSYRIIWVDDRPDWVDSVKEDVAEHLRLSGYDPEIAVLDNGDDLTERCKKVDVDLILIDYHLPGKNGDALISDIRRSGTFTQIVFYSQAQLRREEFNAMDGVFLCQRDEAVERIRQVIDLTLHKLRDIGVVRGLVITEAIDLEVMIEELVISEFEEKGALLRERIVEKSFLDFETKWKILHSAVEARIKTCESAELKDKLETADKGVKRISEEVGDQRNILAHSRPENVDGKIVLKGINKRTKEIEFGSEWLADLRTTFRKHRENLHELGAILRPALD